MATFFTIGFVAVLATGFLTTGFGEGGLTIGALTAGLALTITLGAAFLVGLAEPFCAVITN